MIERKMRNVVDIFDWHQIFRTPRLPVRLNVSMVTNIMARLRLSYDDKKWYHCGAEIDTLT